MPLIAGVGTNDTPDSIEFAKEVAKFGGFVAGLAIVPYYNKPSQEGMYQHFKAIADASDLPIIIYNIPGRVTGDDFRRRGAGVVVFERQHGRSFCCGLLAIGKVWFRAFGRRG